ncbi:hypothetical protein N0V90_005653 [Kalmusia sp. IMI 367209]|nr:hypothetical protein N0V90_005653 [Kalmusia sp. IMI 367209]
MLRSTQRTTRLRSITMDQTRNILITGAAGYIGGSILADFISRTSGPIATATFSAAVRSEKQVQALSKLGINVVQLDLSDAGAVTAAVEKNQSKTF